MGLGLRRVRDSLAVAEIALAFALALGATLLIRELVRLRQTNIGMTTANVVTFHLGERINLGTRRGAPPAATIRQFYEIADRVAQLPGVRAAGFTQVLPLQNWGWSANSSDFRSHGLPATQSPPFSVSLRFVTPGYFQALGIPIRRGRGLTASDNADAPPVILINETLARLFGNQDPVGMETNRGTIVGIVGDVRQVNVDRSAEPELYYAIAQNWSQLDDLGMSLIVSTATRPEATIEAVRTIVRDVNPDQAIFNVRTMDRVVADSLAGFTLYLSLMTSFAALAVILASTGMYGVLSYIATSRTREFAIRIAVGAHSSQVTRLVLGQGLRLTAIGIGMGLMGALAATPLLGTLPASVRPPDLATTAPVAALVGAVAIAACLLPAHRAAGVDPMSVLRRE